MSAYLFVLGIWLMIVPLLILLWAQQKRAHTERMELLKLLKSANLHEYLASETPRKPQTHNFFRRHISRALKAHEGKSDEED